MRDKTAANHPKGTVLLFTLVVLALMALMGAAIMANTRTEMNITGEKAVGQEAFNRADATLTIALMLTRQLAKEFTPAEIADTLKDGELYKVVPAESGFEKIKLQDLGREATAQSTKDRYLSATYAASRPDLVNPSSKVVEPFIRVYRQRVDAEGTALTPELIGTATAAISSITPMGAEGIGASVGESKGDPSDGANIKMYYVVTADGRASRSSTGDNEDQNNYYNGGQGRDASLATHSIITTIYADLTY